MKRLYCVLVCALLCCCINAHACAGNVNIASFSGNAPDSLNVTDTAVVQKPQRVDFEHLALPAAVRTDTLVLDDENYEITEYYESGLMRRHESFKNGLRDGISTIFSVTGDTCYQYVYSGGVLANNYYTMSGNGYSVDYDIATGEPLWRDVDQSTVRNVMDEQGNVWKTYAVNGLYVSLNVGYRRYYGKYFLIDLYIQNNSGQTASFDFDNMSVYSAEGKRLKLFSRSKFERRTRNRIVWLNLGLQAAAVATSLALDAALHSGDYYERDWGVYIGPGGPYYYGDARLDLASFIIIQAQIIGSVLIAGYFTHEQMKIPKVTIGYLHNYQIAPKSAISGFAYAKYNASLQQVVVNIPINGKVYVFSVNASEIYP